MANRKTQQTEREKEFEVNLTPRGVVKQGLLYLKEKQGLDVKSFLDFSAGSGVYCSVVRELWPTSDIVAVEPREEQREVLLKAGANALILKEFDLEQFISFQFDLAASNPPFSKTRGWVRGFNSRPIARNLLMLDKTQAFQRSVDGVQLLLEVPPDIELRIGQGLRFRQTPGTDGVCYSHWYWNLDKPRSKTPSWTSVQLDLLHKDDRKP